MDATVGALAVQLDGEVLGDAERAVEAVGSLDRADSRTISFIGGETKLRALNDCQAGVILISRRRVPAASTCCWTPTAGPGSRRRPACSTRRSSPCSSATCCW